MTRGSARTMPSPTTKMDAVLTLTRGADAQSARSHELAWSPLAESASGRHTQSAEQAGFGTARERVRGNDVATPWGETPCIRGRQASCCWPASPATPRSAACSVQSVGRHTGNRAPLRRNVGQRNVREEPSRHRPRVLAERPPGWRTDARASRSARSWESTRGRARRWAGRTLRRDAGAVVSLASSRAPPSRRTQPTCSTRCRHDSMFRRDMLVPLISAGGVHGHAGR